MDYGESYLHAAASVSTRFAALERTDQDRADTPDRDRSSGRPVGHSRWESGHRLRRKLPRHRPRGRAAHGQNHWNGHPTGLGPDHHSIWHHGGHAGAVGAGTCPGTSCVPSSPTSSSIDPGSTRDFVGHRARDRLDRGRWHLPRDEEQMNFYIRPRVRPAGQVPTGLPTGPIQQTGSSVSTGFVLVTVGLVAAAGALAVALTAPVPQPVPTPARIRSRR